MNLEHTCCSLVIPVYKNFGSLPPLLSALQGISAELLQRIPGAMLEVVFVVDASPDASLDWLTAQLPGCGLKTQLLVHSRNFGSFAAIRSGLATATGDLFAVMAADLQEPPELVIQFFCALHSEPLDVVIGTRDSREDPYFSKLASRLFWATYRRFVQPEMPSGGIDMFGCNSAFKARLLELQERNSSLVGLLMWLGFRRKVIGYHRRAREHGKSAWTLGKKLNYLLDSVFAFSDLPLKLLMGVGAAAMLIAAVLGVLALVGRLSGHIQVPGYTMLIIAISFFGALNTFALGVVGSYVWRAFENTKNRPMAIVCQHLSFNGLPTE